MKPATLLLCFLFVSQYLAAQDPLQVCDKSHLSSTFVSKNKSKTQNSKIVHCDLHLKIDQDTLYINGYNTITYITLNEWVKEVYFYLSSDISIDSLLYHNQAANYRHENNQITIEVDSNLSLGALDSLLIYYSGVP